MQFSVQAYGFPIVSGKFKKMGSRAQVPTPAMKDVLRKLVEIERTVFASEGRRGGGSWRNLSASWLQRKQAKGLDLRKLRATGALYRSLTSLQSSNMIRDIKGGELVFGSRLPYAAVHQFGNDRIPARPYLSLTRRDNEEITNIIKGFLLEPFGRSRGRR